MTTGPGSSLRRPPTRKEMPSLPVNSNQGDLNWYKPGPKMAEFHLSKARIRALIGGRGTGKTTGIAVEIIGHGFWNAGAKAYVLRKTQDSNEDTTLETFELVFAQMGSAYQDTGVSLFKKMDGGKMFRLPSKKAIELMNEFEKSRPTKAAKLAWLDNVGNRFCSWLCFAGVPSSQYRATRFRGYECSLLCFVEADQLAKEDLDLGVACLRWKGADPSACDSKGFIRDTCVILDTNPPSPRHWIAQMELDEKGNAAVKFWHIPTEENRQNLPDNYIEDLARQYRNNPAMYNRMLLGEYDEAFEGNPVLFAYTEESAAVNLAFPRGAYLVRGWDFGTTHAVIWSAYYATDRDEYWWDLKEYFAQQSDTERQCRAVVEITDKVFPFWNDRAICSGVLDFCDIAGKANKDTGSSIKILKTFEIYPSYASMRLQESLAVYNRLLERRDKDGKHCYRIDKKACETLWVASRGGYRYPQVGEPGYGKDEPGKGPTFGDYDHLADASRYAKMGCLRIIKAEALASLPKVGKLAHKVIVNRKKDY